MSRFKFEDGITCVVVELGQPTDYVQIGIGDNWTEAVASMEQTPVQCVGRDNGLAAGLRWAHGAGWITSATLDRADGNPSSSHLMNNRRNLARSNPPGDLTYRHFYRTGGQDCANVISLDEFDLDLGTAEQIVADATSDWDDDLERDWRSQMDDEDFEGLDPHEAFEQWKAGWRAQAVRIIADRLKER